MKTWFHKILVPHRDAMVSKHDLGPAAKIFLYWDIYSVHIGAEMRDWIGKECPWIILLYVPAGCTGVFQPCDVGLQRVYKHHIKQSVNQYFCAKVQRLMKSGTDASLIRLLTDLGPLRDASVGWIIDAIEYLNSDQCSEIRLKSWKNCAFGTDWNLSWDYIDSKKAARAWMHKPEAYQQKIMGSRSQHNKRAGGKGQRKCPEDCDVVAEDDDDVPLDVITTAIGKGLVPKSIKKAAGKKALQNRARRLTRSYSPFS